MGDTKNLTSTEAIKKLKEMAEDIKTCMFCTRIDRMPIETRPMSTRIVDEEGNIWFISSQDSHKNLEIKDHDEVQLIYAKNSDFHFLSVYGHATILKDKDKIEELWTKWADAWFEDGKKDPNVTLICVKPKEAYYWDTKDGKMVSLIKIAFAAVSGKTPDDGIEGTIRL